MSTRRGRRCFGSAFERKIEANLDNPRLAEVLGGQTAAYKAATRMG